MSSEADARNFRSNYVWRLPGANPKILDNIFVDMAVVVESLARLHIAHKTRSNPFTTLLSPRAADMILPRCHYGLHFLLERQDGRFFSRQSRVCWEQTETVAIFETTTQ